MLMMAKLKTMTYIVNIFTIIDGQDDDFDYTTMNLNHGYGNDFELDHIQSQSIIFGHNRSYSVLFSYIQSYAVIFSHSHI